MAAEPEATPSMHATTQKSFGDSNQARTVGTVLFFSHNSKLSGSLWWSCAQSCEIDRRRTSVTTGASSTEAKRTTTLTACALTITLRRAERAQRVRAPRHAQR